MWQTTHYGTKDTCSSLYTPNLYQQIIRQTIPVVDYLYHYTHPVISTQPYCDILIHTVLPFDHSSSESPSSSPCGPECIGSVFKASALPLTRCELPEPQCLKISHVPFTDTSPLSLHKFCPHSVLFHYITLFRRLLLLRGLRVSFAVAAPVHGWLG